LGGEPPKSVVLFANAGAAVGMGHLFRSLAVGEALGRRSIRARLLVPREAAQATAGCSVEVEPVGADPSVIAAAILERGPDRVVIDSYPHLRPLARALHDAGIPVAVFDDEYTVEPTARWVVNASPHADADRYRAITGAALLLGPRYASVAPVFREARRRFRVRERLGRVLVALGGTDAAGNLGALIDRLEAELPESVSLDVVGAVPARTSTRVRWHGFMDQPDLADLMARSDAAVLGGGSMLMQSMTVGLPAVAWPQVARQRGHAAAWSEYGGIEVAEEAGDAARRLSRLADSVVRRRMAGAGRSAIDGKGPDRIAAELARSAER
jgi:spore coat polysaccharide biosynthesis predicted glycosyltransferase SpsG